MPSSLDQGISKEKTLYLKGIGILFIAFHNFFHLSKFSSGENEFSYSIVPLNQLVHNISFGNSVGYLFSYFGHYGVQFFIFLSGYGLAISYKKRNIEYFNFIKKRLWKLYPVFTLAIIALFIHQWMVLNIGFEIQDLKNIFLRYTLLANFIPGKIFVVSGPYWFYSMIVQLYILFPFLMYIHGKIKWSLWIIAILALALTFYTNAYFSAHKLSLYYNFVGNLPVFILGMLMALHKELKLKSYIWLIAAMLFSLGQYNNHLWYLTQLSFIVIMLQPALWIYNRFHKTYILKFFIFTGSISMYIFAVNGFLRKPWTGMSKLTTNTTSVYLYALVFILSVYLVAIGIRYIEKWVLKKIRKNA